MEIPSKEELNKGTSRRNALKLFGLTAIGAMISSNVLANNFVKKEEILQLNSKQQEFMVRYGQWMDNFIDVIRIKKAGRDSLANQQKMIALTEQAESFKPELKIFMQDKTFSFIYETSIQRMSKEI